MLKLLRNKKGQGFIEYALVLALIVGVILVVGNSMMKQKSAEVYNASANKAVAAVAQL
jgi:Flp pilus assembly pilin Flp